MIAVPGLDEVGGRGDRAFAWIVTSALPRRPGARRSTSGSRLAMYGCGLARDDLGLADGLRLRPRRRPARSRSSGGGSARRGGRRSRRSGASRRWWPGLHALATPVYATITAVCTIFLYISYVVPTALGALAYGRSWTRMGPWDLGRWYRPLAVVNVVGCLLLIAIGMQPPNDRASGSWAARWSCWRSPGSARSAGDSRDLRPRAWMVRSWGEVSFRRRLLADHGGEGQGGGGPVGVAVPEERGGPGHPRAARSGPAPGPGRR